MMMMPRSLVSSSDLSLDDVRLITANARKLLPLIQSGTKKNLNHLGGRTVATFFCEPSTRTRCSFELAAKVLGAHTLDVSPENSSLAKGETISDTIETLVTMGVDAIVIRHKEDGLPQAMAEKYGKRIALLNAGDGVTDHPTQGLLDILTLMQQFGSLEALQGKKMTILGNITHSRVVGSHLRLMQLLGVSITLVAPDFFMPNGIEQENWQQAYGVYAPGFKIRCKSNTRDSVLVYEPTDGKPVVLKPAETFSITRWLFVAQDLAGVLADYADAREQGDKLVESQLIVQADGYPVQGARIALKCGDESWGTVVTEEDGTVVRRLPSGSCEATISVAGQEFAMQTVTLSSTEKNVLELPDYHPGVARIAVTDAEGRAIPAKIEFKGNAESTTPNWGPETSEYFVKNLAYTASGKVETELAAWPHPLQHAAKSC